MNSSRGSLMVWLATFIAAAPYASAQVNAPHLAYALPAGGQQGTTIQVKLGGQFLTNAGSVWISGGGIQAKVGEYSRPINGMQATQLRARLQELQKQPSDSAIQKEIADIRFKLFDFVRRRDINPVLAENVGLEITIAPDAAPGRRELRLRTQQGLSNPLTFYVGSLREFTETEQIAVGAWPGTNQPQFTESSAEMTITLPATVNGRIKPGWSRTPAQGRPGQQFTPGDADRYRFQARKGQQLIVAVSARDLIPYLADAVPGWFQATLTLYDQRGKELAYEDDYRFNPDPVLHYQIPADGEYVFEIKDSIYRGREDFIYRITLGELPFIISIFPLGGLAGTSTRVELKGWNLPVNHTVQEPSEAGIFPVSVHQEALLSNSMPFAADTLPECLEKEPNSQEKQAQKVALPVIINGRVDSSGDWDVFRFEGRAGEQIVAEVMARRLNSPLDSTLQLTDSTGRQLAANDDHEDKGSGLTTHHADSWLRVTLPTDGIYYVRLGDAQRKGGPEYAYRLRIGPPRPDFALRVAPSSISTAGGISVPITVYALRKDGFSGDIALTLKNGPLGFVLSGGLVAEGQNQVRLTLSVPPIQPPEPIDLILEGLATIQGQEIRRTAVPAEDMMQAFAYHHLVPAEALKVAFLRRVVFRVPPRILGDPPLKIPAGGSVRLQAQVPALPTNAAGTLQYELSQPPEGIELKEVLPSQEGPVLVLQCDAAKAKAGLRGNLIVALLLERQPATAKAKAQANRQRIPMGTLPAIPFEIVQGQRPGGQLP